MADLATLEAQRDALIAARSRSELTVEYEGRRLTNKSDPELAAALADVERRIGRLTGQRVTDIRITSSKGLY